MYILQVNLPMEGSPMAELEIVLVQIRGISCYVYVKFMFKALPKKE